MVKTESFQFDIEAAQKLAEEQDLDVAKWALKADVSVVTLRKWLNGDRSIKIRTIDDIVRPLGLTAIELIRKNGKKRA